MSESVPPLKSRHWAGRVLDVLAIATICGLLLIVIWRNTQAPGTASVPTNSNSTLRDINLELPIADQGMLLTKDSIPGNQQAALVSLQQKCESVLSRAQEWVLPLDIREEEQRHLALCRDEARLHSTVSIPGCAIYIMPQRAGLIGVREPATESTRVPGTVTGRRVICWGFVVSDGANGHSLWFARPALSLPAATKGTVP